MKNKEKPKPREQFNEIAAEYDKMRLDYPQKLYADIFNYTNPAANTALEIGAGTGKATRPFLEYGYNVTAVEIGENLAAVLREKFADRAYFNVIVSDFESAPLEENAFDLIYSATAFHWVNASVGCPKVFRLLKSGGTFALFRYKSIPADGEAIYEELQKAYEKFYHKPYTRPDKKTYADYKSQSEIEKSFGFKSLEDYGFQDTTINLYSAEKSYSADEYLALLETFSDHRSLPKQDKSLLYTAIKNAIAGHGGLLKMHYVFQLYMGRKP